MVRLTMIGDQSGVRAQYGRGNLIAFDHGSGMSAGAFIELFSSAANDVAFDTSSDGTVVAASGPYELNGTPSSGNLIGGGISLDAASSTLVFRNRILGSPSDGIDLTENESCCLGVVSFATEKNVVLGNRIFGSQGDGIFLQGPHQVPPTRSSIQIPMEPPTPLCSAM